MSQPMPSSYFDRQYAFVRGSRAVLLDYCASISSTDLLREDADFGKGSIRNLLVHINNTYQFWLGAGALGRPFADHEPTSVPDLTAIRLIFEETDAIVGAFCEQFGDHSQSSFTIELDDRPQSFTAMKLFTHVLTHEFHHKGQIVSLGRKMGYVPPDTDINR